MSKFQMGLVVLCIGLIGCVVFVSCDSIQDMMTMPGDGHG